MCDRCAVLSTGELMSPQASYNDGAFRASVSTGFDELDCKNCKRIPINRPFAPNLATFSGVLEQDAHSLGRLNALPGASHTLEGQSARDGGILDC